MKNIRKLLGGVAVAATVALTITGCAGSDTSGGSSDGGSSAPEEVTEIDFGYIADFNGTSLLAIAEDQGLWDKYGLSATATPFTNGPLQIQALGTGDLDFGYIGPGAFWLPASGQAKIIAINTLGTADRVIAQPGINSIEDLKGKSVGVPEGTSGDMILTLALEAAGMTKDDVEIVPMDAATVVTAFASGQIDAAGIWYPSITTIKEQIPDLVELAKNQDFEDTVQFPNAFVAGNDFVDSDPETVQKVVQVIREANDYRAENPEETIQLTADLIGVDVAQVESDYANVQTLTTAELDADTEDGTIDKWLSGMVDYFVGAGQLPSSVEPSSFYLGDDYVAAGE